MSTSIGIVNAGKLFIETDHEGLLETLYEKLRYEEPEFKKNQWSKWNGIKRMFDRKTGVFPYGLLQAVLEETLAYGITPEIDPDIKANLRDVTRESIQEWVYKLYITNDQGERIQPYDYQVECLFLSIKYTRYVALAATNAGKSLIQYMLIRFWQELMGPNARILLVVPTIQLTEQMRSDFTDYSLKDDGWDSSKVVHVAGDGVSPYSRKPVIVSTWQTLINQEADFFHSFNFLIGDEAHTFSSKSLEFISTNCINAYQRIGLTGSLKKAEGDRLRVMQHFGPIKRIVKNKELQDRGISAKTKINLIKLNYNAEFRKELFKNRGYAEEIEALIEYQPRNDFIMKMIHTLKGNSLFMFDRVDDHLLKMQEMCRLAGKAVFVIHGSISVEDRELIKKKLEAGDDLVLLATFRTVSTGINIRKLHNLVLCHPTKSIIRILQTIGRMLRLHDSKDYANIYDIIDVANYMGKANYAMEHAAERVSIYIEEEQPYKIIELSI